MPEVALVINTGPIEHVHSNGLAGTYYIPPKPDNLPFGLLVVYPVLEIQDIGDKHATTHEVEAHDLAAAIAGVGADSKRGSQGVLLCSAAPEMPKELLTVLKAERKFLTENPPQVRYVKRGNSQEAENIYPPGHREIREKLSADVIRERDRFHNYCRTLVTPEEVATANRNMVEEFGRLIADGDRMWARPSEQVNISDLHRQACRAMGQERPWSYTPQQLVDCPGCAKKIPTNALVCGHCGGILDEDIAVLAAMPRAERARRLYPERYAEADALTSSGGTAPKERVAQRR